MSKDIYFESNYAKLYEKMEKGVATLWKYEGAEGSVKHLFIYRKIPIEIEGGPWYDIVTPYGYGGPIIERLANGYTKEQLEQAFEKAFEEYCKQNNIVSEFVRFHPLVENGKDFVHTYGSKCIRETVGTNLRDYDSPFDTEFSRGCRKSIKQAIRKGVSWRVTQQPENIETFKEIYYSTMDRNHASEYYYFDDEYFANCIKFLKEHLLFVEAIYENKTIAAGLYFIYEKTIHIHLSGTLSEYLYLSPAYILRYATMLWGKEHGYEMIHHGGGRTNELKDSLFVFKKQFGQNTGFDFYIGKRIWNNQVYKCLCEVVSEDMLSDYFPAYRR